DIEPGRHLLPDGILAVEVVPALVDVAELGGAAELDASRVGLLLAGEHLEESRLTRTIWTDYPDDAPRRQLEREIVDQQTVPERFRKPLDVYRDATEPRSLRDLDLRLADLVPGRLFGQPIVGLDARLRFGLARLGT